MRWAVPTLRATGSRGSLVFVNPLAATLQLKYRLKSEVMCRTTEVLDIMPIETQALLDEFVERLKEGSL